MNYVYLLRCSDGSLYCGWTTDLAARLEAHNSGKGAKYTRSRLPVELVYYEEYEDRHEALSREWHIKRLSREEKLALIEHGRSVSDSARKEKANMQARIEQLKTAYHLQPHPEGGWFSEVYTAPFETNGRALMGSIYFLLSGNDVSHFHQIDCDELWYHHEGCALRVTVLHDGVCQTLLLGNNAEAGERSMAVIPAGAIFAAEPAEPNSYAFLSCATTPAFRYEGFRLISRKELSTIPGALPEHSRLALGEVVEK